MNEIKNLESDEGVKIHLHNQEFILRATLTSATADSFALHDLFGLLSPAANYFCPICTIHREDFQKCVHATAPYRSKDEHAKHVKNSESCKKFQSLSIVRVDTSLNISKNFHLSSNFISDIMHNMLEGVAPYSLKLVLHHKIFHLSIKSTLIS